MLPERTVLDTREDTEYASSHNRFTFVTKGRDMTGIDRAHITINAGASLGTLTRPWTTFGYDELNWTYTPRGKAALKTFGEFAERP